MLDSLSRARGVGEGAAAASQTPAPTAHVGVGTKDSTLHGVVFQKVRASPRAPGRAPALTQQCRAPPANDGSPFGKSAKSGGNALGCLRLRAGRGADMGDG